MDTANSSNTSLDSQRIKDKIIYQNTFPKPSTMKQRHQKSKTKQPETWKKQRLKLERHSAKELPTQPSCGHREKGMHCLQLSPQDIQHFQKDFYKDPNKVKQDIFILRHCSVSAPKRCRSKDGIQKKTMVVHYNAVNTKGHLVPVCRKTFTQLLGVKFGRVQGVLHRYIQSKQIPTENRGGDRHSKKFEKKLLSVCNFLGSLQGTVSSCSRCGGNRTIISPEYDIRKLWHYYNSNTLHDLRVVESYFRNIFIKNYNISFGVPKENEKDKEYCYKCYPGKKESATSLKKRPKNVVDEDLDLKILEMSYPPGEHFLFAPIPSSREPLGPQKEWRSGDESEYAKDDSIQNTQNETAENISINTHSNSDHCRENSFVETQTSSQHAPVSCDGLNQIHYQSISNITMPANQESVSGNMSNVTQQTLTNIHIPTSTNYIIQPQTSINQSINLHNNTNIYSNNMLINVSNSQQTSHLNPLQIASVMNLNANICNDDQCNVIHLGNHYENLHNMESLSSQEITEHHNLTQSLKSNVQQNYTVLSLGEPLPNNEQQYQIEYQTAVHLKPPCNNKVNKKSTYKCLPCKLTFKTQSTYCSHIKQHSDTKFHQCDICDRKFRRVEILQQHIRTHSKAKPFECSECSLSFAHRINLDIHMKRHKSNPSEENQNHHSQESSPQNSESQTETSSMLERQKEDNVNNMEWKVYHKKMTAQHYSSGKKKKCDAEKSYSKCKVKHIVHPCI